MSISAVDMESEQNGRPTNGSPTVVQRGGVVVTPECRRILRKRRI